MSRRPEIKVGLAGRFKLEAVKLDADGNEISRRVAADWFDNLITDQGLEFIGTSDAYINACHVGSGTTTPTVLDTGLVTFVAGTTNKGPGNSAYAAQTSAPYYGSRTMVYRFNAGTATGNLSEVGVGTAAAGAVLFSRALILDGGGAPTTITILADEVLDVTYQLRVYPPLVDAPFNITISGVVYSCVLRASNVTNSAHWGRALGNAFWAASQRAIVYDGAIGAITAGPSGNSATSGTVSASAYVASSLERVSTLTFSLTSGNVSTGSFSALETGTNLFDLRMPGSFQISFSPNVPKTAIKTLVLTFKISWARKSI